MALEEKLQDLQQRFFGELAKGYEQELSNMSTADREVVLNFLATMIRNQGAKSDQFLKEAIEIIEQNKNELSDSEFQGLSGGGSIVETLETAVREMLKETITVYGEYLLTIRDLIGIDHEDSIIISTIDEVIAEQNYKNS